MNRAEILSTAKELTMGERNVQHGSPLKNHQEIAQLWTAWLNHPVKATDVAAMMVLLKLARTKSGVVNDDNFVDGAAYAAIMGEIAGEIGL